MIKVEWDVEELVALIDIYRYSEGKDMFQIDKELQMLSATLNYRASLLDINHDEKYRNLNGMKMMYQNVVYVASDGERGMSAASTSLRTVYMMMQSNPVIFNMILNDFNKHYKKKAQ